ncbi:hypothetical protein FN846DRAFT_982984, partial [Sphaerosporella brunnea]
RAQPRCARILLSLVLSLNVACRLITAGVPPRVPPPTTVPRPTVKKNTELPAGRFSESAHMPTHVKNKKTCYLCRWKHRGAVKTARSHSVSIASATVLMICMTRSWTEVIGGVLVNLSWWGGSGGEGSGGGARIAGKRLACSSITRV